MKIMMTGHSGLIGTELQERFKENDMCLVDRENDHDIIPFKKLVVDNPDVIIHLASNCMIREIIKDPDLMAENVWATYQVYEAARKTGCKKVVYFSSSRVNHDTYTPYTAGKMFGEHLAKAYKECYDIETLIIRPETVWDVKEKKDRVIPLWIKNAQNDAKITVYGGYRKILSPIHVKDFCDAFMVFFENFMNDDLDEKIWSISGYPLSAKEVTDIILNVTGSKSEVEYLEPETGQPQGFEMEENHAFGKVGFEEALKREL